MQQPAVLSSVSRSLEHSLLLHVATACTKIFAAKGRHATVVNFAGQAMGSKSFLKIPASKTRQACLCKISLFL